MPKSRRRTSTPDAAPFEALESRLALAADFTVALGAVTNQFERGPDAEMIRATATIRNVGDMFARGQANLELYFSLDATLDDNDSLFEVRRVKKLPMPGATATVNLDMKEPTLVNPPAPFDYTAPDTYFVIAKLVLDQPAQESSAANNTALGTGTVTIAYEFGLLNGKNRPIS